MSFTETLCLVLAAVYALACILLSIGVALSWHAGLERRRSSPIELLTLRLLPAVGAAFLTLTVALPAFLIHEPHHERRSPQGPCSGCSRCARSAPPVMACCEDGVPGERRARCSGA